MFDTRHLLTLCLLVRISPTVSTSDATTMQLQWYVNGACVHVEGRENGQFRGPLRKQSVQAYKNGSDKPLETFKKKTEASAKHPGRYHSNNSTLGATNRSTQSSIAKEARAASFEDLGLTKNSYSNAMIASRFNKQQDLNERRIRDGAPTRKETRYKLLGNVRRHRLEDEFTLVLFSLGELTLWHTVAKEGNLIVHADATGGTIDFPSIEDLAGKTQLMMWAMSPKAAMPASEALTKMRLLSPIKLLSQFSSSNTGRAIQSTLELFTEKLQETFSEVHPPLMVITDYSPATWLAHLRAFNEETKAITLQYYAHVATAIVFHVQGNPDGTLTQNEY